MKKPTSAKQLAANQRNAKKSTGPRTPQGREVSRQNALKHGILSKQVLVKGLHYAESSGELEALHERFWEEFQPSGPLEEMLVDQIVTAHWRWRRALTAESGEIALSVDKDCWNEGSGTDAVLLLEQWGAATDMEETMQRTRLGNSILLGWLEAVRRSVERENRLTAASVQELALHFHNKPACLVIELENLCDGNAVETGGPDAAARHETNKTAALTLINERMDEIRCRRDQCVEHEDSIGNARQAAAVLPSAGVLDKILRYETKLERQMYRAMTQLERVQRMRRGEAIPAPLTVEVADRGSIQNEIFAKRTHFNSRHPGRAAP